MRSTSRARRGRRAATRSIGASLARRAARGLEESAGIPSTSLAALLHKLDGRPRASRRTVLVVDEAAMVSTRQLAELVGHVARSRAKLVLVGDHHQLPELEAGGAFRALATRLEIELKENRRQAAQWERDALTLLRDGRADEALRRYRAHGRVIVGERRRRGPAPARRRLVGRRRARRRGDDRPPPRRRRRPQRPRPRAHARRRCARRRRARAPRRLVRRRRSRRAALQRPAARRR